MRLVPAAASSCCCAGVRPLVADWELLSDLLDWWLMLLPDIPVRLASSCCCWVLDSWEREELMLASNCCCCALVRLFPALVKSCWAASKLAMSILKSFK